jgi:hypothetical protein
MSTTEPEGGKTVAVYSTPQPVTGLSAMPSNQEWRLILQQADWISRSGIVPKSYQSIIAQDGRIVQDRRPNVVVATLMGRTFGWDLLTAMRNIHVIEGAATLKPEALLGLIRSRGHKVKIIRHPDRVDVYSRRVDTGDEMNATFSFEDAVRADLCKLKDGRPWARSKEGKPLSWEKYPVDMCQWRATAIIARGLYSDITLGLGYLPEELGALVDAEGEVVVESGAGPEVPPPGPDIQPDGEPDTRTPLERYTADLEEWQARVADRNTRRTGPDILQAKARAWDALKDVHPDWDQKRLIAAISEYAAMMGTTPADATVDVLDALTEQLAAEKVEQLRTHHGLPARDDEPVDAEVVCGVGNPDQPGQTCTHPEGHELIVDADGNHWDHADDASPWNVQPESESDGE